MFYRIIRNFTKKSSVAHLGRWNTIVKETENEIHVKNTIEKTHIGVITTTVVVKYAKHPYTKIINRRNHTNIILTPNKNV